MPLEPFAECLNFPMVKLLIPLKSPKFVEIIKTKTIADLLFKLYSTKIFNVERMMCILKHVLRN